MKKRAKLVVMVLGIALAIAGCGQDKSSTAQSETVTQVSTQGSTGETTQETKESKAETESVKETAVNTGSEASSEAAKEPGMGNRAILPEQVRMKENCWNRQRHLQMIL